ncbi:MAG: hypothetical protein WCG25_08730 [bacterium]
MGLSHPLHALNLSLSCVMIESKKSIFNIILVLEVFVMLIHIGTMSHALAVRSNSLELIQLLQKFKSTLCSCRFCAEAIEDKRQRRESNRSIFVFIYLWKIV